MNLPLESENVPKDADSMSGFNTYSFQCDVTNKLATFLVCQHIIVTKEQGTISPKQFSACQRAIDEGKCVACVMRKREQSEGRVIYFEKAKLVSVQDKPVVSKQQINRAVDKESASYKRGRYGPPNKPEPMPKTEPTPKKKGKAKSKPVTKTEAPVVPDYGDMVNEIVKEEAKARPKKGESLRDFIKRTKGTK